MNNLKLIDKNTHKFIFFKVKDYETILAGRFDASNDFAYIQRGDGTILEKYERCRLEHIIEIPNDFEVESIETFKPIKDQFYEFKPFEKIQMGKVKFTGKIWEIGEHPDYKNWKIYEVIDEEGKIHEAFEKELTIIK